MKSKEIKPAVIYARVSSMKQVNEGNGLRSQVVQCSSFAQVNGYRVIEIFEEEGVSGAKSQRPSLLAMFEFLKTCSEPMTVLISDVSRLARDVQAYHQFKTSLQKIGARLVYVTQSFSDTPEGQFMETIMVSFGEMDRKINQRRVIDRMKARMSEGYWVVGSDPAGYKPTGLGGVKEPDYPYASVVKNVLERYAYGDLNTYEEIARAVNAEAASNYKGKKVFLDGDKAKTLLKGAWFHAGFLECPKWGISRRKGKHPPIITADTLDLIERRLAGAGAPKYRKNLNVHFPLRGHVLCDVCGRAMTAAFCGGHGYYYCRTGNCRHNSVHVPYQSVHSDFEGLLGCVSPKPELLDKATVILHEIWNEELAELKSDRSRWDVELDVLGNKIQSAVDQLIATNNRSVKTALEKTIDDLTARQTVLRRKIEDFQQTQQDFGVVLNRVVGVLKNPQKLWREADLPLKQTVQRLVFPKPLVYAQDEKKFRNPVKASIYSFFEEMNRSKDGMVVDTVYR